MPLAVVQAKGHVNHKHAQGWQVTFETGPSMPLGGFDTLLFHGRMSDPRSEVLISIEGPKGWGPWIAAAIVRRANGRFWGRIQLSRPVQGRVRLLTQAKRTHSGSPLEIFAMEAFLGGPEARRLSPQGLRLTQVPQQADPPVVRRQEWGARPPRETYSPDQPNRITLHHSQGPQPSDPVEAAEEMRFLQEYHQRGRGWNDIAYHYVIDGEGRIYQGRPEGALGAHTKANNEGNVGICLMGCFEPPCEAKPTAAQLQAVIALGRRLGRLYNVQAATLRGHRDYVATDCPGEGFYPHLPALRSAVGAQPPAGLSRLSRTAESHGFAPPSVPAF